MKTESWTNNVVRFCVCLVVPLVCIAITGFSLSCKMTATGIETFNGDTTNPELVHFEQVSENSIALYFSETISLSALEVATGETLLYAEAELEINDIPLSEGDAIPELAEVGEKRIELYGKEICFAGDNKTKPGEYYVLSGTATDQHGNSLKFRIPFYGFNSRKAGLVISEVRTAKNGDKELEFIELYVYRPGNLAGISVSTAIDSKNGFEEYVFPATEVDVGEYIVLHMRNQQGAIDEIGDNLKECIVPLATPGRDFWVKTTDARIGDSDIVLLKETAHGKITDAVLFVKNSVGTSYSKTLKEVAGLAIAAGVWDGTEEFSTWVSSENIAGNRTFSRINIAEIDKAAESGLPLPVGCKKNWIITTTSGDTPGLPNSNKAYVKK